jgi:hypothetical protein
LPAGTRRRSSSRKFSNEDRGCLRLLRFQRLGLGIQLDGDRYSASPAGIELLGGLLEVDGRSIAIDRERARGALRSPPIGFIGSHLERHAQKTDDRYFPGHVAPDKKPTFEASAA